jgi:hypothetical protein
MYTPMSISTLVAVSFHFLPVLSIFLHLLEHQYRQLRRLLIQLVQKADTIS